MGNQQTIWQGHDQKPTAYPERPFAEGSDTSWYAAYSIPPDRLARLHALVLGALWASYPEGLTDDELATKIGEYRYSVAPRRKWLVEAGLVEDSGDRRMGPRGRKQVVWVFMLGGSFVEPTGRSEGPRRDGLTYPDALRQIDALHRLCGDGVCCPQCGRSWPCDTNAIIEKTRARKPGESA